MSPSQLGDVRQVVLPEWVADVTARANAHLSRFAFEARAATTAIVSITCFIGASRSMRLRGHVCPAGPANQAYPLSPTGSSSRGFCIDGAPSRASRRPTGVGPNATDPGWGELAQ